MSPLLAAGPWWGSIAHGTALFKRHRLPASVISQAVGLYYRFTLSYRDIDEPLAQRGVKSQGSAQRARTRHAPIFNTFNLQPRLIRPLTLR